MNKNKKLVDLEGLKVIRSVALKINDDITITEKVKQDLTLKLLNIHHNCSHELVVRYKDNQVGRIVHCLCCTKIFYGSMVGLDCYFQNIIDIPDTLKEDNIPEFALKLFEQASAKHPGFSDSKIVTIINEQIKQQTMSVKEQDFVKSIGTKNE